MLHRLMDCRLWIVALAASLVAGCDAADSTSIRITLNQDLSGSVSTACIERTAEPGSLDGDAKGVDWETRARIAFAHGSFASLDERPLEIADIRLESLGEHGLRVIVPRGASARWPALVAPSGADREAALQALDAGDAGQDAGTTLKISIELPAEPVAHGVHPGDAAKESTDGKNVSLLVDIESARAAGPAPAAIVWDLTWN